MNKTELAIGVVGIVLIASAIWFLIPNTAISPSPDALVPLSVEESATSSVDVAVPVKTVQAEHPIVISSDDTIVSWDFVGAYANNAELSAKAYAEIARLTNLIGEGTYPDVNLYVSIANQYEMLGNGNQEYTYLELAIKADPKSGLPWHNLGVLMEKLGATKPARIAYDKAVLLQPQFSEIQ
jgi:tetratricopeptide (TPR) repeat protein